MNKISMYVLLLIINFWLSSCEYKNFCLNNNHILKKWEQHRECLLNIKNYKIYGTFSGDFVKKRKNIPVQFIFQNNNCEHYQLTFINPIGLTDFKFNISEDGKYFSKNKIKHCLSIYDFEKIVKRLIHLDISFNNFQKWILGLPGTEVNFCLNNFGCLKKIFYFHNDMSFTVLYKSYFNIEKQCLPRIIEIYYNNHHYFNVNIHKWIIL